MNIETTVNDISLRVNKNREIIDDNFIQLDNRIKQLAKDYDQKLSLYQEISDKSLNQNIENLTSKLNNKISSSKQVISAFKNEIQRKLEDLTNIPAIRESRINPINIADLQGELKAIRDVNTTKLTYKGN